MKSAILVGRFPRADKNYDDYDSNKIEHRWILQSMVVCNMDVYFLWWQAIGGARIGMPQSQPQPGWRDQSDAKKQ